MSIPDPSGAQQPGQPQQPAQYQQQQPQQQYPPQQQQPQYAPQQQQQPQQQYAPQQPGQYQQQQYAQRSPQQAPRPAASSAGRLNVLGVIALAIQVLVTFISPLTATLIFRATFESGMDYSFSSVMTIAVNLFWVVVVGGLGIAGVMQKNAPRMRWTAISAVVVAALGVVSILGSLLNAMTSPLFY